MKNNKTIISKLSQTEELKPPVFTGTPPKEIIEGVASGVVAEMNNMLGTLALMDAGKVESKLSLEEALLSSTAIIYAEIAQLNDLLKDCGAKTLSPKHQVLRCYAKLVAPQSVLWFETLKCDKDNVHLQVETLKNLIRTMQDFHLIMMEDTPHDVRKEMLQEARVDWEVEVN